MQPNRLALQPTGTHDMHLLQNKTVQLWWYVQVRRTAYALLGQKVDITYLRCAPCSFQLITPVST